MKGQYLEIKEILALFLLPPGAGATGNFSARCALLLSFV